MDAWNAAGYTVSTTNSIPAIELVELLQSANPPQVLDVREPAEWQSGHIDGADHLPFYRMADASTLLDPTLPTAVICGGGERSVIAASILQRMGWTHILNVSDGMSGWHKAMLPVVGPTLSEVH